MALLVLQLATKLLNKEVLNYDDLVEILGYAPHGDKRKILKTGFDSLTFNT